MRSIGFVPLVLLMLFGIAPADAADGDVMKKFGLYGRLAIDCAAPASSDNPHLIYAVSPLGKATRTLKMTPELDGTFPMYNVRLIAPDKLQHGETGRQSELIITIVKIGGKYRSWSSVRADGTVLIADGKFPSSGRPTLAFNSCRN